MKSIKMRGICAAVTGALLFGFGANAMADSTTDIVNALVAKGVLTEEEGALLNKGREGEAAGQAKAMKKASKLSVSDAIDNAKIYGDIRARYERRDGNLVSNGVSEDVNRSRYKITLGVETKAGDWYSDLAFAMSDNGRSDNVSFGEITSPYSKDKSGIYIKRAMLGWNVTPWLSVEAGRMKNPLYMVNAMVFDHDIVFEGVQEKLNYKVGETNLFANLGQWVYTGLGVGTNTDVATTQRQNMVLAFQAGAQQAFNDRTSAKAAVGYYNYTGQSTTSVGGLTGVTTAKFNPTAVDNVTRGVNNLQILDVLGEANYMATSSIGVRPYAEYAVNTDASARQKAAGVAGSKDDNAWLVGVTVGSAKDLKSFEAKKMGKGDWSANLWYQSVGAYALDANSVDTDIFDGRINMEGTSFKAQYNVEDNVALNFTGAWGDRKNDQYATVSGAKVDVPGNIKSLNLYQFDVTYKF